jgi:hypothetical protein
MWPLVGAGQQINVAGGATVVVGHRVFVPLALPGPMSFGNKQKHPVLFKDR